MAECTGIRPAATSSAYGVVALVTVVVAGHALVRNSHNNDLRDGYGPQLLDADDARRGQPRNQR